MTKYKYFGIPALVPLLALVLLAGCSQASIFKPYFITLDQGNIFTQEQVADIEQGMTGRQVRFILGTPTIVDTFNPNRWDYLYTLTQQGELHVKQHLAIIFEQGKVIDIQQIVTESSSG